jgi:predicted  nucleic acid-binding Zn-ribbon protein
MEADPNAQLTLLDVQELDSRADLLRHQRTTLPELAEITALQAERADLDGQRLDAQITVDDLTAEQSKVDADVEQVRARRTRDRERMDQGLITNPKDLQRMQGELESLERRITTLEDDELEVMERLEEAQGVLDSLVARIGAIDERLATLAATRDAKFAEIDAGLVEVASERTQTAANVPEDLLTLYDRLRGQKGGVGAAELRARQCGGCRLTLDNAELAVLRSAPAEEVIRCEECQRILVRTPESGL